MTVRVLVADDHAAVRGGVISLLNASPGMEVCAQASRADEVLAAARASRPDVAVVDFHMPGGNGLALAARLEAAGIGAVIYTAHPDSAVIAGAIVARARAVVAKSASPHELVDAVRSAARGDDMLPTLSRADVDVLATTLEPSLRAVFRRMVHRPRQRSVLPDRDRRQRGRHDWSTRERLALALSERNHALLSRLRGGPLHYAH